MSKIITWRTEKRKVSDLKGYKNNPRQMTDKQFQDLINSIKKFNYVELTAINTDNTIIAGHQRVRALIKLGRDKEIIEVRVPDRKLSKKEFDEYLIRSNKITGDWDEDILKDYFKVDDLSEWGFSEDELSFADDNIEFKEKEVDETIETEHTCPKCGYKW